MLPGRSWKIPAWPGSDKGQSHFRNEAKVCPGHSMDLLDSVLTEEEVTEELERAWQE